MSTLSQSVQNSRSSAAQYRAKRMKNSNAQLIDCKTISGGNRRADKPAHVRCTISTATYKSIASLCGRNIVLILVFMTANL